MSNQLIPVIFVNLAANNKTAAKKWKKIKGEFLAQFSFFYLIEYEPPMDLKPLIVKYLEEEKVNCILYAGGDGTMNHLLNLLMNLEEDSWRELYFGGIGLGSSNDFQKPYKLLMQGIPTRLQLKEMRLSDIGYVRFETPEGNFTKKYFLINASLGVTAQANLLFNQGDAFLNQLKPFAVGLAIVYAAVKTILTYRLIALQIENRDNTQTMKLSNLAVLKMPTISGSFQFSQAILPDDGQLGINICENMTTAELLKTLYGLSKGQFKNDEKRQSFFATHLKVQTDDFVPLETDGEVYLAKNIEFGILPKHLKILGQ